MRGLLRFTLLADGSSDAVLMPILDWLVREHAPEFRSVGQFARDFGRIGNDLESRVKAALERFPCDLLFIHRDAEGMSREQRLEEIRAAMNARAVPYVAVIPVRMTEAWLFADEDAIRFAAGNSSGRNRLALPAKRRWEQTRDPKAELMEALRVASGRSGRALTKFDPERQRHLITTRSASFDALRGLAAFDALEADLTNQLEKIRHALD